MTNVSKVQGPSGPLNRPEEDSSSADSAKFHAEMKKKVTQVRETDPDEQKKRKSEAEADVAEKDVVEEQPEEPTPASGAPPFLLTQDSPQINLLGMQPSTSSAPTPAGLLSSLPLSSPPPSSPPPTSIPEAPTLPATEEPQATPSTNQPQFQQPTSPNQVPPETNLAQHVQPTQNEEGASLKQAPDKPTTALPLNLEKIAPEEDTGAFFAALKEPAGAIKEGLIEGGGVTPSLAPSGPAAGLSGEKRKIDEEEPGKAFSTEEEPSSSVGEVKSLIKPPSNLSALNPYAKLPTQTQELFDKMVGVMTVLNLSGMTETTFTLNTPQFASSVFFGAQIIIREFSTAPQVFNIQLNGSAQAVDLFQANAAKLMAAFQARNDNFSVHRLETGIVKESPFPFKSTGAVSDEQQQDGGERNG